MTKPSSSIRSAGLRIEHQCRQCGAPVDLEETDRLIRCPYCRVRSYLVTGDVLRYVLPHRSRNRPLLYFPYWRFRGVFYACTGAGVEHRLVDASLPGIEAREFPPSLGLRAQTMPLRFASPDTPGRFLPATLGARAVTRRVAARCLQESAAPVLHHEFVGETLSLIYAPFHLDQRLLDAVTDRPVPGVMPADLLDRLPAAEQAPAEVRFIPALCPQCGWDLDGSRDSLVLTCGNCRSALRATSEGLAPIAFERLPAAGDAAVYLPFWRVESEIGGAGPASEADRLRVANVLGALCKDWEARRLHLWVPAFKIRPEVFLLLARAMTLAQPREDDETAPGSHGSDPGSGPGTGSGLDPGPGPGADLPDRPCHPVNLSLHEAIESLKVVLASLLSPPATYLPQLPRISIQPCETRLVFVPFSDAGTEWVHGQRHLAVNKNALGYGLQL